MDPIKAAGILRSQRKREHVQSFQRMEFKNENYFEYIYLEHQALPELNLSEIQTYTDYIGTTIDFPLIINGMTRDNEDAVELNDALAEVAAT